VYPRRQNRVCTGKTITFSGQPILYSVLKGPTGCFLVCRNKNVDLPFAQFKRTHTHTHTPVKKDSKRSCCSSTSLRSPIRTVVVIIIFGFICARKTYRTGGTPSCCAGIHEMNSSVSRRVNGRGRFRGLG